MDGVDKTIEALGMDFEGFVFTNLVDFDSKYGHRRDPIGYGKCIEEFDARIPEILEAILKVMPLDTYVEKPAILMEKMDCDKDLTIPVWDEYKAIIAKHDERGADAVGNIDRFDFYDEAKDCYCVIQTGETSIYANVIVQKGVIK